MQSSNTSLQKFDLDLIGSHVGRLFQILPDLIYVIDLKARKLVFVNDRITEILGYTFQDLEAMGNTFDPILLMEDRAKFGFQVSHDFLSIKDNETIDFTLALKHKNGTIRTLRHRATILKYDEQGHNEYVMLTAEDITQYLEDQKIIETKQQHFNDAEKAFNFGSWEWKAYDEKVFWTDGLFNIMGVPKEDYPTGFVSPDMYNSHIPEPDRTRVLETAYANIDAKIPYYEIEHPILTYQGETKDILLRSYVEQRPEGTTIIGTVSDITIAKKYELELANKLKDLERQQVQMEEAEAIFKFGSWEWLLGEDHFRWSDGMFKLLGLDSEDYPNQCVPIGFYMKYSSDEETEKVDKFSYDMLAGKKNYYYELNHLLTDVQGTVKHINLRARCFYDDVGNVKRIVGVSADVTQLENHKRELESQLIKLNKSNQELENFAYVASHDLQEPLRKIVSFGERLEKKYKDALGDDGVFLLSRMVNATQRMNQLIDDLLRYSRASRQMEDLSELSLNQTIDTVLEDLELKVEKKAAIVECGVLPSIEAQPIQMQQLFQNLIGNSLKFSKKDVNPIIKISATKMSSNEVKSFSTLNHQLNYYRISLSDNGIGFESQYAEKIFTIFQRLHGRSEYEGTGLGLAICRKIVESHHGLITAQSQVGQGATFTILLPTTQPLS